MTPDKPHDFHRRYDGWHADLWEELKPPNDFDEQLARHWAQGMLGFCIRRIDAVLVNGRGLRDSAIAQGVGCPRAAVTRLLNDHHGGINLVQKIYAHFGLPHPGGAERRNAGHRNAMAYTRTKVLGRKDGRPALRADEWVALYFLFHSDEWVKAKLLCARAHNSNNSDLFVQAKGLLRAEAAAISRQVRDYWNTLPPPDPKLPRVFSVQDLEDLIWEWGDAYLLYVPQWDPEWELTL